jgi:hypothetical protein
MIGGTDHVVGLPPSEARIRFILKLVFLSWTKGVFLEADDPIDAALSLRDAIFRPLKTKEFFIYQDQAALRSWEKKGATRTNDAKMLHFVLGEESFTIVSGTSKKALADVRSLLEAIKLNAEILLELTGRN